MRITIRLILAIALFLSGVPWIYAQDEPLLKGIDVYRSRNVTVEQARKAVGPLLQSYVALRADSKRSSKKAADRLKGQMEAKIMSLAPLAYLSLSYQEYVTSAERSAYVTFDIVDAADAKVRLPFNPAPQGNPIDPEGLLSTWQKYSDLGDSLARKGLFSMADRPKCPSFYCVWGSRTPELAQFEEKLLAGATPNHRMLRDVLAKEADPKKRAAAVYVMAYMKDGNGVVDMAQAALLDPSVEVRSAGLQVLADMAIYYRAFPVNIDKIIAALDYPTTSDRSRALAVLVGLSDNPSYKDQVISRATPYLLALLRTKQPSSHDLAFTLLATLSQENHGRRDYPAWSSWVEAKSSTSAVTISGVTADDGD